MITISSKDSCDYCTHIRENKDGWIVCCDAFPDGLPDDYCFERVKVAELEECAPGFHFEPDIERQKKCRVFDKQNGSK